MAKACNPILHVRCMFVQKRALVSACVHGHNRVCVSCLLNRSKSVRNEGEALIHCSSNTISVRLRLCSKFLAAKRLSYFLTDEPGRTISRTPSAVGMDELIESTSIDPMGPLTDQQRAEREEIYKQHALESDDTEDSEQDAQEARV
mgnify:CR=1 FL=1